MSELGGLEDLLLGRRGAVDHDPALVDAPSERFEQVAGAPTRGDQFLDHGLGDGLQVHLSGLVVVGEPLVRGRQRDRYDVVGGDLLPAGQRHRSDDLEDVLQRDRIEGDRTVELLAGLGAPVGQPDLRRIGEMGAEVPVPEVGVGLVIRVDRVVLGAQVDLRRRRVAELRVGTELGNRHPSAGRVEQPETADESAGSAGLRRRLEGHEVVARPLRTQHRRDEPGGDVGGDQGGLGRVHLLGELGSRIGDDAEPARVDRRDLVGHLGRAFGDLGEVGLRLT